MKAKRIISVAIAIMDTLLFGGVIFGWPSLDFIFKRENYFTSECGIEESTSSSVVNTTSTQPTFLPCPSQDISLNFVYTLSTTLGGVCTFPLGYLYDRFGNWKFRSCGILAFIAACAVVALSTAQTSWLIYIAMPVMAVSSFSILISNTTIGYFCTAAQATMISIIYGAFDSSAAVMVIMKTAYQFGASITEIFVFYGALLLLSLLYTFGLMPRMHVPFCPPDNFQYGLIECCNSDKNLDFNNQKSLNDSSQTSSEHDTATPSVSEATPLLKVQTCEEDITFTSCLKDLSYWLNVVYLSILQLRIYTFYATLNQWLATLTTDRTVQSEYITVFGFIQLTGIFFAPFSGLMTDFMTRYYRKVSTTSSNIVRKRGMCFTITSTCVMSTIFSILVLIPILQVQYVTFVVQNVARTFLYAGNGSFIATTFPSRHFGKLNGLALGVSSVVSLLSFPINILVVQVFNGSFLVIDSVFLGLCLVTFVHPITLYSRTKILSP